MAASPNGPRSLPAVLLAAVASKYEHEPVLILLVSGRERTVLDHDRSPWHATKDHASDTRTHDRKTN